MKQLSQLFVLSSMTFISASTSQEVLSQANTTLTDDVAVDVPARHVEQPVKREANRGPAVEPRVYVEDEKTGGLYYYDYPKQVSHAEQSPPQL